MDRPTSHNALQMQDATIPPSHVEKIWSWNAKVPDFEETCVHTLITATSQEQPHASAVCAWDGDFTYAELEDLSTKLAHHLIQSGLGSGKVALLLFEKSKYAPVAMLAVMKSGAASIAVDHSQPDDRIRAIIETGTPFMTVSSHRCQNSIKRIADLPNITVDEDLFSRARESRGKIGLPSVHSAAPLYINFTSGTTGTPKGVVVSHRNFSSAIRYQQAAHGFSTSSRVYDFASYSFDVSWSNILHTFSCGGCLCIPSDEDRKNDLAGSIQRLKANHADLTPSAARLLPTNVIRDCLRTLVLGGEALRQSDAKRWAPIVNLINPYGPSECTPTATLLQVSPEKAEHFNGGIGKGVGVNTWIVNPENPNELRPLGCPGELLLEGPIVGDGYFNDPVKTSSAFLQDPSWLRTGCPQSRQPGRTGRLYKTGDLVKYDESDGSLIFLGRKDAQVKINGQRVELGDIETNLFQSLDTRLNVSVIADLIRPRESSSNVLVAFIETMQAGSQSSSSREVLQNILEGVDDRLAAKLPPYMIPRAYLPIGRFPLTPMGKIDRRQLRSDAQEKTLREILSIGSSHRTEQQPQSEVELSLQAAWSKVLDLPETMIGTQDSFLRLGGDSIKAMMLVSELRSSSLAITVADVFRYPKLNDLARVANKNCLKDQEKGVKAFSLLQGDNDVEKIRSETAKACDVAATDIVDAFPCTSLQEGLLALTIRQPGAYVGHLRMKLASDVRLDRFRRAIDLMVDSTPMLRTRVIDMPNQGLVQVIVKQSPPWTAKMDPTGSVFGLATPLVQFHLDERDRIFSGTLHHALYDGWSVPLLLDRIREAYRKDVPPDPTPPYQEFVKHSLSMDQAEIANYWAKQVENLEAQPFPDLPAVDYQPKSDKSVIRVLESAHWPRSNFTASTGVRAAWAIVMARYTNSKDVIFGATVTGRQAPVKGVEQMTAPTLATVPLRIQIDWQSSVRSFLDTVQSQGIDMVAFEQTGLQKISKINNATERACKFQSLLLVQQFESTLPDSDDIFTNGIDDQDSLEEPSTYALTLECFLGQREMTFRVTYDSNVVSTEFANGIAAQFDAVFSSLCIHVNDDDSKLKHIATTSTVDIDQIWTWNADLPQAAQTLIHDLISQKAREQPQAMAICSWDGNLSYYELDEFSTSLARWLVSQGVGSRRQPSGYREVIPLCFEKSRFTPVAALAVMKAGAASVTMDPAQPEERLRTIVQQLPSEPSLIISSCDQEKLAGHIFHQKRVFVVDESTMENASKMASSSRLPEIKSSDLLFINFTSGTTGIPKGVMITHENFASAIKYQQKEHGFHSKSRVYDFASYAFDVSWSNFIHTLTSGGCLCIPSDADRRDELVGSIEKLDVTHVDVTPSTARLLPDSILKRIETLVLGGEALHANDARRWATLTSVKNPYGPSECTPTSTLLNVNASVDFGGSIGKGLGVSTWVVDPNNAEILLPVGAIGELLLEGPIVGPGYLGDPIKTAASFITSPAWLLQGNGNRNPGRSSKLYKTGDLVRYNADGSLRFLGRKDTQVKINGQRVELGDIESHIRYQKNIQDAMVLLPKSGPCEKRLIGVFSSPELLDAESFDAMGIKILSGSTFETIVRGLENTLSNVLPTYMIPSIWIALEKIPLTTSGKPNNAQVNSWLSTMDQASFDRISCGATARSNRDAESEIEAILREGCSHVLNVQLAKVNLERSFIANGGDSIAAMRLRSHCGAANMAFTVASLLKNISLAEFARTSVTLDQAKTSVADLHEEFNVSRRLSPIQAWHLNQVPNDFNLSYEGCQYNQAYYARTRVPLSEVEEAVHELVKHHSMLRAHFIQENDVWMQSIPPPKSERKHLTVSKVSSMDEVKIIAAKSHQSMDIRTGKVFSADLCTLPDGEHILLLVAHHLVVDIVSWSIIAQDLETLVRGGPLLEGIAFTQWNELQMQHVLSASDSFTSDALLSTHGASNDLDFWSFNSRTPNAVRDHDVVSAFVDTRTSAALLTVANSAFGTEPVDLILASIWDAFFHTFPQREALSIFNEGHGREAFDVNIDLSRTVGWFTTIAPLHIERTRKRTDVVRMVKDARRRLPMNGWAYFAANHFDPQATKAYEHLNSTMEVVVNYHGQSGRSRSKDSLFEPIVLPGVEEEGKSAPASSIVNIEAFVKDGQIGFEVNYNRHVAHQASLRSWFDCIGSSAKLLVHELGQMESQKTLCDYEYLSLGYDQLDDLQERLLPAVEAANNTTVEAMFPCSPTVEGILISQLKDTDAYKTSQIYTIRANDCKDLTVERLADAWNDVIARQPSLRTVFVDVHGADSAFAQALLTTYKADVTILRAIEGEPVESLFAGLQPIDYTRPHPQHRLTLCPVAGTDSIACLIEMSHAITDGKSTAIILDDWTRAFAKALPSGNLQHVTDEFSQALLSRSKEEKMSYWKTKLDSAEACNLSPLTKDSQSSSGILQSSASINNADFAAMQRFCYETSVTPASLFQAAWALTVSSYTGMQSVCFGYVASGRDLPIAGLDECIGAFVNLLICRADVSDQHEAKAFVQAMHEQVLGDINYQHLSLADIQNGLNVSAGATLFNTLVSYQTASHDSQLDDNAKALQFDTLSGDDPTEYVAVLSVNHAEHSVELTLDTHCSHMTQQQNRRMLSLVCKILQSLTSHLAIRDVVGSISDDDLSDMWNWNANVPETIHTPVHELIVTRALNCPDSAAVDAWDGQLTYAQLDSLSTKLARYLVSLGVRPGRGSEGIVPICSEKSMWTAVAMIAVMKAGGASVLLDASQPIERLKSVVDQVNPILIISSKKNHSIASAVTQADVVVVGHDRSEIWDSLAGSENLPRVVGSDKVYLIFTSGSTGAPKGVVITHANISSAIKHQKTGLGYDETARSFDFASYTFDPVWCNLYQSLAAGGTLCIPNDDDRKADKFIETLNNFQANIVIFTPSALRGMDVGKLETLKRLHYIGEPLRLEDIENVDESIQISNLYGPSECTTFATMQDLVVKSADKLGMGHGTGLNTWLVQPANSDHLAPLGTVGELMLEGPLVGEGYLDNPEKTAEAFIEDPKWLVKGTKSHAGRKGRLYKTGDLVRYDSSGSLTFVGRKDAQVKIRGQRVELGDIEHQILTHLDTDVELQLIADVVKPEGASDPILVAFINLKYSGSAEDQETVIANKAKEAVKGLSDRLAEHVPAHMIPTIYLPFASFPMTASGKTDRKRLREQAESMSLQKLTELNSARSQIEKPSTTTEMMLARLWSSVLGINVDLIGAGDSFLRVGGDSIRAMKLVSRAREEGLSLTVANVLQHPKLSSLAQIAIAAETATPKSAIDVDAFSLLHTTQPIEKIIQQASELCEIDPEVIEDIYPCTPIQEGMIALTERRPGDYIIRDTKKLRPETDVARIQQSWDIVQLSMPILRTRIIDLDSHGLAQVVLKQTIACTPWTGSVEEYISHDEQSRIGLGTPLMHIGLVEHKGETSMVWTIHHTLYDGWSLPLILQRLDAVYQGGPLPSLPPFKNFVKHVIDVDQEQASNFWKMQLESTEAQTFPALPFANYQPKSDSSLQHHISALAIPSGDFTISTVLRVAWGILISQLTDVNDAIYGVTVTGRQADVNEVASIVGPTIATIPMRMKLDPEREVNELLQRVQAQASEMTKFEQFGLQKIQKLSAEAEQACRFQSLLVIQPAEDATIAYDELFHPDPEDEDDTLAEQDTYAMTIECQTGGAGVPVRLNFDSAVVSARQVQRILQQFEHLVHRLLDLSASSAKLIDVNAISDTDLSQIWTWNAHLPTAVEECLHERILKVASTRPHTKAIDAWDGTFLYADVIMFALKLAFHLRSKGVGTGHIIPLCFRKSKWTPITMLAVMITGAASVALDPSQPEERLCSIVGQVKFPILLTSEDNESLGNRLTREHLVLAVDGVMLSELPDPPTDRRWMPQTTPKDLLYLNFTSGSTGVPKGAMISHANMSSAIFHQQKVECIDSDSRILDFASYAFDVAWLNVCFAFSCGACLCTPSDEERRDDLALAMDRLKVTHAEMTPSSACALPDRTLKALRTLVVGGERLMPEDAHKLASLTILKNSYGPSECTPSSTFTDIIPADNSFDGSIGSTFGLLPWIVDAKTGSSLAPVGTTGELWLEGPLVGQGYFADTVKTSASFVDSPPWLARGFKNHPGRHGRLYRTGDLVRYGLSGDLIFVGRKDAQVKIRGQRVELSDIESHIKRHSDVRQCAVLIPSKGSLSKRLVGLISLRDQANEESSKLEPFQVQDQKTSPAVRRAMDSLATFLEDVLPTYMIPSEWVVLRELPLNSSSKLNHKEMQLWLSSLSETMVQSITNSGQDEYELRQPQSDAERVLRDVAASVLNIAVEKVNLERSFIANGGDSISAMRFSSHCRALNIVFPVAKLLKSPSLLEFAQFSANNAQSQVSYNESYDQPFELSPIQRWFFQQVNTLDLDNATTYYAQSFCLRINRNVSDEDLRQALDRLVQHHTMLRARFHRSDAGWTQFIPRWSEESYEFHVNNVAALSNVAELIQQRHEQLDVQKGPVFCADVCTAPGGQRSLSMVAHHLVIDLVSWRIIVDDLEALLEGSKLPESLPFQVWNRLQREACSSLDLRPDQVMSDARFDNDLEFHGFDESMPNTSAQRDSKLLKISESVTDLVLGAANEALHTEPVELLLASVWGAFFNTFDSRHGLSIFTEGHGREAPRAEIDLSRTIGWFTTMYPSYLSRSTSTKTVDLVRSVKDSRRRVRANGWAYFASRYLTDAGAEAFATHNSTSEVVFNYSGLFQQFEGEETLFSNITFDDLQEAGSALPVGSLFEINAFVEEGQIQFSFSWNRNLANQHLIQKWITEIEVVLTAVSSELSTAKPTNTLIDYKYLSLDYTQLDHLQHDIIPSIQSANKATVVELLPCLPMVDGILLKQVTQPTAYKTVSLYRVKGHAKIKQLVSAWQTVIQRQPALRSVFIPGLDDSAAYNQAILDTHQGDILVHKSTTDAAALRDLKSIELATYNSLQPPHRLVISQSMSGSHATFCRIEMNHAITDGASSAILLQDWIDALEGVSNPIDLLQTSREFASMTGRAQQSDKRQFWQNHLSGSEPCSFPRLLQSTEEDKGISNATCSLDISGPSFANIRKFCEQASVTPASIFHSAWALTLAIYTGKDDVSFGYLASGRESPIAGLDKSMGAYANVMICRANAAHQQSKIELVRQLYNQLVENLGHQYCSLADIHHDLGLRGGEALFNTMLSFQEDHESNVDATADTESVSEYYSSSDDESDSEVIRKAISFEALDDEDPTEYPVGIDIAWGTQSVHLALNYSSSHMLEQQAESILSLLRIQLDALSTSSTTKAAISTTPSLAPDDLRQISDWNSSSYPAINNCIHGLIKRTAARQPGVIAVDSWDGSLTYGDLEALSSRLALHLVGLGLNSGGTISDFAGSIVPLCFQKSKWTPVAMLAVMKAGGASVTMDPSSQPEDRLAAITQQVRAKMILASENNTALVHRLMDHNVIILNQDFMDQLTVDSQIQLPSVRSDAMLFINFTSGSTGVPKGVVLTHRNMASAIEYQQDAHGFKPHSRVYDFASYAFDVAWSNFIHTLTIGACLCIPSDEDRKNHLAESIEQLQVTHCDMTPSAARLIPLDTLAKVKTLVLGGEALREEDARRWAPLLTVKNPYGPSECTPTATLTTIMPDQKFNGSIGRGVGMRTWIVDPRPSTSPSLVPVGCVGELLLEGPLVGPGYLGEPGKTAEAFIEVPAFVGQGALRLYKTGDLVRYAKDGSLLFVGRKDAQVKIHGQRVELGDIEHHVKSCLVDGGNVEVVVEVVRPQESATSIVTAFMAVPDLGPDQAGIKLKQRSLQLTAGIEDALSTRLPAYMIPSIFFPLERLPITATGKTDRRALRTTAEALTLDQLSALSPLRSELRQPTTTNEITLRQLWADVLQVKSETIGADDSFVRIGGDSIGAMKLVEAARKQQIRLTVADILLHPKLCNMALRMDANAADDMSQSLKATSYRPFSLLGDDLTRHAVDACVFGYKIKSENIQDMLPVTDEQARYVSLTYSRSRSMLIYHHLDGSNMDPHKIRDALRDLVRRYDALRTAFVAFRDEYLQVVLKEFEPELSIIEEEEQTMDEATTRLHKQDMDQDLPLGIPTTRFAIIRNPKSQQCRVIMRVSHAQHDGISMANLWTTFEDLYDGKAVMPAPSNFSAYMHALSSTDTISASQYWLDLLAGSTVTPLYSNGRPKLRVGESPCITRIIERSSLPASEFTLATILRAAWSWVVARHSGIRDVTFGNVTSGRGLMHEADDIFGACVNVVPARVSFSPDWTIYDLLEHVKTQQVESLPHEYLGSRSIIQNCTDWQDWAYFSTVIHHNNFSSGETEGRERGMFDDSVHPALEYDIDNVEGHLHSYLDDKEWKIQLGMSIDFTEKRAIQMTEELVATIRHFAKASDEPLFPNNNWSCAWDLARPLHDPVVSMSSRSSSSERSGRRSGRNTPPRAAHGGAKLRSMSAMQALSMAWIEVLGDEADMFTLFKQNMYEAGGDLITASQISSHMARQGFLLPIEDILENPTWGAMLDLVVDKKQT